MVVSERLTAKDKIRFLFLITILFCTYPYVFNLILPLPPIMALIAITFMVTIIVFEKSKEHLLDNSIIRNVIFLQFLGTIISLVIIGDSEYLKQIFYIAWLVCFLGLIRLFGVKKFIFIYNRIILIVALFGVLAFFLSFFLGGGIWFEYTNMDGRPGAFIWCTFSNNHAGNFIRYSGIFDEPGAMAYWGMFALVTNKLYVKDKIIEIPLMIALTFTFSLAYYIQIAIYLLYFYAGIFTFKKGLFLAIIALGIIFFLNSVEVDSPLYNATLRRMGIGSSGIDVASENNRVRMMEEAVKIYKEHPLFGIGPTAFYGGTYAADNPYETLAKDGIVGTFFLYLPLLVSFIRGFQNKDVLVAAFILLVGYLQRPFHINFIHYTMLYLFFYIAIELCKKKKKGIAYVQN